MTLYIKWFTNSTRTTTLPENNGEEARFEAGKKDYVIRCCEPLMGHKHFSHLDNDEYTYYIDRTDNACAVIRRD